MAKKTDAPNREFNVESESLSVHDDYLACLRILALYSRTHEDSVVAYAIWGGRKKLGLKFQGRNVTIGGVTGGDIPIGVLRRSQESLRTEKIPREHDGIHGRESERGNLRESV